MLGGENNVAKVTFDISMSLDGFITGPNDSVEQGLGEGGEQLHRWLYDLDSWRERHGLDGGESTRDAEILDEAFRNVGAVVIGRRMFDIAEEEWGDNPPFHVPVFIVTHRPRQTIVKEGGTSYIFVTEGVEAASEQARAAAGDKDISIGGGADIIQQFLKAGMVDELQIHIVPLLLGSGTRLFEQPGLEQVKLERARVVDSPTVTHVKYRVVR